MNKKQKLNVQMSCPIILHTKNKPKGKDSSRARLCCPYIDEIIRHMVEVIGRRACLFCFVIKGE